jgi:hypothetical protein
MDNHPSAKDLLDMAADMDKKGHVELADDMTTFAQNMMVDDFDLQPDIELGEDEFNEQDEINKSMGIGNSLHALATELGSIVGFSVEDYYPQGMFNDRDILRMSQIIAKMNQAVNPSS